MKDTLIALFGPDSWFRNAVACIATAIWRYAESCWGQTPEATQRVALAALILYLLDFVTGVAVAARQGRISSKAMQRGFYKFIAYASSVLAAFALDEVTRLPAFWTTAMLVIIAFNELTSIAENSDRLGFRWPVQLMEAMARVRTRMIEDVCREGDEGETGDESPQTSQSGDGGMP